MDTIYSRRKIRLPKDNKYFNKIIKISIILGVAFFTIAILLKSITPIFETRCKEKVKEIATNITNTEASNVLKDKDYSNIVELIKDDEGNISIIKNDVVIINEIASDIALGIQNELTKLETEDIKIPLGSFLGSRLIAGIGPNIHIKLVPAGNIKTDIKTEFKSTGINQTIHRIYLELECEVEILTPFDTINSKIVNQVLLVETVIIGEIPSSYYNLEGMSTNNMVDLVR